ncbi:MAG TPA: hypothetical protein VFU21_27590, partial [Kofleriaceae bacterium]|nr:hypothetical protein [Kofleriaceae bacterium]
GGGGGGGGGGGDGGDDDAGVADGDAGAELTGRLCAAVDLRVPLACPAADLGGITVAADLATDTTDDAGVFTLAVDPDAELMVAVSGGDTPVRASAFATGDWRGDLGLRAPVVELAAWDDLVAAIGGIEPDGTASLALYLEDDSGPIAGAEVLPPDGTGQQPYYDDGAPDEWVQGGLTSAYGAALILAVPTLGGSAQMTVAVDAATYTVTVPVRDDTLTFARVLLDTSGG